MDTDSFGEGPLPGCSARRRGRPLWLVDFDAVSLGAHVICLDMSMLLLHHVGA
jgi:hypothetical protein